MNFYSQSDMHAERMSNVITYQSNRKEEKNRTQGKTKKFKKLYFFLLLLMLFAIVCSFISGLIDKRYIDEYFNDVALANTGMKNLQTGISLIQSLSKNPLDTSSITQAQHAFAASYTSFIQLDTDLKKLPEGSASIPVYGSRLSAALKLAPLAVEMSQAGIVGCNTLSLFVTRFHQPLSTGHGMTMEDLTTINNDLQQLKAILNLATVQVNALQPSDVQLDPSVGKAIVSFHKYLPALQSSMDELNQLLPVLPALLGIDKPANYFVEVLDSTELRPGGGFVGNYGIATIVDGRLTSAHLTDTYLLDQAFTARDHSIAYPSKYTWFDLAPSSWSLRDSNLDADFPTDARNAEQNYKIEGGNTPLQGVIAITPFLIQRAFAITGPIAVPEYHEIITAQNLIDRIHYYQEGPGRHGQDTPSPDGKSSVRKHFAALLAEHFIARIHQLPSSNLPKLFQLLISSLRTKDMQVYFNAQVAENLLTHFQLDSSIQAPANDSLFVVDANISPNKASQFITNTLDDQVSIDEQGNIVHRTTITYDWKVIGEVYGSSLYRDYLRIYIPSGSILQTQQGLQPKGTGKAFGRDVLDGFFTLSYGQIRTISITWTERGVAKKHTAGWRYQYFLQRQAGSQWNVNIQILLPSCTVKMSTSGGLTSKSKQVAVFTQSLTKDTNLGIDYSC